jgi:hypothetical protein
MSPITKIIAAGATLCLALDISVNSAAFPTEAHTMPDIKGRWSGTFDQFSHDINGSFPTILTVEAVSGDQFTGTMDWPTFDDTQTRVQGMFDGELIIWTETEYLRGDDAVLHGLFVARVKAGDEIAGDWMDPKHTIYPKGPRYGTPGGRFSLRKQ